MAHVTEARVLLGPWPRYAGMQGWVRSSAPVYHKTTGTPIFPNAVPFLLNWEGYAEIKLPFTDRDVNNPANFTYEIRWISGYQAAPPSRKFRLPSSSHVVNYTAMVESSTIPGLWEPPGSPAGEPPIEPPEQPSSGSGAYLTHVQSTPAASWIILHELGRKPAVTLVLPNGKQVYTDIEYPNDGQVTVIWPTPTVGEAHLS